MMSNVTYGAVLYFEVKSPSISLLNERSGGGKLRLMILPIGGDEPCWVKDWKLILAFDDCHTTDETT